MPVNTKYRPPLPYWLREADFALLPSELKHLYDQVVLPVYGRTVVGAQTPIERSIGTTVAFLTEVEVKLQLELARQMGLSAGPPLTSTAAPPRPRATQRLLTTYLQVVREKQKAIAAWNRIREASDARGQLTITPEMGRRGA